MASSDGIGKREEAREPRLGAQSILAVISRSSGDNRTFLTEDS